MGLMDKCDRCKKLLLLRKKNYVYPGKRKGSFELTDEKIYCEKCINELYPSKEVVSKIAIKIPLKIQQGKFKEALELLEKGYDKNTCDYWYNKGNVLTNLGKIKESLSCYDEAIFIDTHYVKAWYRKGERLFYYHKFKEAIKCFGNVLELEKPGLTAASTEKQLEVRRTVEGFTCSTPFWAFAAMLMRALSFVGEKNLDKATEDFAVLHLIPFPPFFTMTLNEFIEFCLKNRDTVLDYLEPRANLVLYERWRKH
jgi:tetratricopeptide (TPR) repeat protein